MKQLFSWFFRRNLQEYNSKMEDPRPFCLSHHSKLRLELLLSVQSERRPKYQINVIPRSEKRDGLCDAVNASWLGTHDEQLKRFVLMLATDLCFDSRLVSLTSVPSLAKCDLQWEKWILVFLKSAPKLQFSSYLMMWILINHKQQCKWIQSNNNITSEKPAISFRGLWLRLASWPFQLQIH